jgi:hypothetical protein
MGENFRFREDTIPTQEPKEKPNDPNPSVRFTGVPIAALLTGTPPAMYENPTGTNVWSTNILAYRVSQEVSVMFRLMKDPFANFQLYQPFEVVSLTTKQL